MKEFFKIMFATMAGFCITAFLFSVIFVVFIFIFIAALSPDETVQYSSNSVLKVGLNYDIPEKSGYSGFSGFEKGFSQQLGIYDITKAINNAANDKKIKAIYLDLNYIGAEGMAAAQVIRRAIEKFKESGKPVYAHGNYISQLEYFIGSAADKIFLTPTGGIEIKGLSAQSFYFKGTFEKLEIEPQIFRKGSFKSAVEIFTENKMSDSDKIQVNALLSSLDSVFVQEISKSRNIPVHDLDDMIKNFEIRSPQKALENGLIDSLCFEKEMIKYIDKKLSVKTDDNTISIHEYAKVPEIKGKSESDLIAVIYATGDITTSPGDDYEIGTENIIKHLRDASKDKNVKGIVLRINSPGGDPLTSDLILNEIKETKKLKPVIVSMGEVAASGGYYIACAADAIVAEHSTLTGSIGVFGMIPNIKNFLENKLGITTDRLNTGEFSDYRSILRPVTEKERMFIQEEIDRIYTTFVNHVAEGRKLSFEKVDEIAQGRVWTGSDAKRIGLVDELGGIEKALEIAAKKAKIKSYNTVEYPKAKDPFDIITDFVSGGVEISYLKYQLGDDYKYFRILEEIKKYNGVQTRIPFNLEIN